jgi:hypothetical protein
VFGAILLAMLAEAMAGSYLALLAVEVAKMTPSELGELIGMGRSTALLSYRDERRLTKTECLAMAAVVSQSSPWSLERH